MSQTDLNIDLKEKLTWRAGVGLHHFKPVMPGSWICLNLLRYAKI